MSERFRLRALLAAVAADPYRKLIAIVLAVGLWFVINGQITSSITRTVSLTWAGSVRSSGEDFGNRLAVVLPDDRVIGRRFMNGTEEIQTVDVTLSGPRFSIERLENQKEPLNLEITRFGSLDWSTRREIEFTAADIRPDLRGLEGLHVEFEPGRIRAEVEKVDVLSVPLSFENSVELVLDDEENRRRLRLDTAEFTPGEARIAGPATAIRDMREPSRKPLLARVRRVGVERHITVALELADGKDLNVKLLETPSVKIPVLPELKAFQFELPVVVDDLALPPNQRGLYTTDTKTMSVRLRAGGQLRTALLTRDTQEARQAWAAQNLRLVVVMPPKEGGAAYDLPEHVFAPYLMVLETAQLTVDHNERLLDEGLSVTLRRQQ